MRQIKLSHRRVIKLGWQRDLPDYRDYQYTPTLSLGIGAVAPESIDLSLLPREPSIWDQGQLGSCTAHSNGYVEYIARALNNMDLFVPSRLAIYYFERVINGSVAHDSGAQIRDGIKVCAQNGVFDEKFWPYIPSKFRMRPSQSDIALGLKHKALTYSQVQQNLLSLQSCVGVDKLPITFGFTVYSSFESDVVVKTGIVPMPTKGERVLGGHAVAVVGYDNQKKLVKIRNSWGAGWGERGYFYMPYDYYFNQKLCSDFWTIRSSK